MCKLSRYKKFPLHCRNAKIRFSVKPPFVKYDFIVIPIRNSSWPSKENQIVKGPKTIATSFFNLNSSSIVVESTGVPRLSRHGFWRKKTEAIQIKFHCQEEKRNTFALNSREISSDIPLGRLFGTFWTKLPQRRKLKGPHFVIKRGERFMHVRSRFKINSSVSRRKTSIRNARNNFCAKPFYTVFHLLSEWRCVSSTVTIRRPLQKAISW